MKLRYRITSSGWYVPQYCNEEKWVDFIVENIGGEIKEIVLGLSHKTRFHDIWHIEATDKKTQKTMPIIFKTELKVCAFLGAAKIFYSDRTKEIEL